MSTLAEIRTEVIKISGRADFTANPTDADLYINKGQRWLEEKIPTHPLTLRRSIQSLAIDVKVIDFEAIRSISEIILHKDSDGSKHALKRMDFDELYLKYSDVTVSGQPKFYAISVASPSPDDETDKTGEEGGDDMLAANFFLKTRVLLNVPVDVAYTAHTLGYFYSNELVQDDDVSIWSLNYPHQLVSATLMQLDMAHRNEDGLVDTFAIAIDAVREIEKDVIQSEMDDDMVRIGE